MLPVTKNALTAIKEDVSNANKKCLLMIREYVLVIVLMELMERRPVRLARYVHLILDVQLVSP